jgi:hypothetical protein
MIRAERITAFASLVSVFFMFSPAGANAATCYIDAVGGSDANNGASQSSAWQTVGKVNGSTFGPGDTILFKVGCAWTSQLTIKNSGNAGNPIVIGSYGTGSKPTIIGPAGSSPVVSIDNCQYIELTGLEITNADQTASGRKIGISLGAGNVATQLRHIIIKNCYIHHIISAVNNDNSLRYTGAIIPRGARFDSLIIEDNIMEDVYAGIYFSGGGAVRELPPTKDNGSTNVLVQRNSVKRGQGDGIVIANCYGAKVQYNFVDSCCKNGQLAFANIWGSWLTNCIYQFNESAHSYPNADGEAFDDDWQCSNDTFQYNYGHDNSGGFFLLCSANYRTPNPVLRYNISQNDNWAYCECGNNDALFLYNNTFYGIERNIKNGSYGLSSWFRNNIFCRANAAIAYSGTTGYSNNCYFQQGGTTPADPNKITADPMFVSPGGAPSSGTSLAKLTQTLHAAYAAYQLKPGSPCIDKGMAIAGNGGRDFGGMGLNGAPDIGACEFSGIVGAPAAALMRKSGGMELKIIQAAGGYTASVNPSSATNGPSFALFGIEGKRISGISNAFDQSGNLRLGQLKSGLYMARMQAGERNEYVRFSATSQHP